MRTRRYSLNPHGPDGLGYGHANVRFTNVLTNVANDNTATSVGKVVDKDLRVTDNGDGTLTILVLTTGPAAAYGPDGKAIARNPGQARFELLVDHGGTVRFAVGWLTESLRPKGAISRIRPRLMAARVTVLASPSFCPL